MKINLREGEYLGSKQGSIDNGIFTICITDYEPCCKIVNHYHDNDYVSILINGLYKETHSSDKQMIGAGDILFRPKNYDHENEFGDTGGSCFNIEFKREWYKGLDVSLKLPDKFYNFKEGRFPSLYKLLIYFKSGNSDDLIVELMNDWLFDINKKTIAKGYLPWIDKIIHILKHEVYCFHSLQSLSSRVFVEQAYMARAFKERQGLTIGEYQLKIKINNAFFQLLNTSKPVKEIAFENGFFDDAHFIRAFKLVYKMSPLQFRFLLRKSI